MAGPNIGAADGFPRTQSLDDGVLRTEELEDGIDRSFDTTLYEAADGSANDGVYLDGDGRDWPSPYTPPAP